MITRTLNAICTNYLAAPKVIAQWGANDRKTNAVALAKIASYATVILPIAAAATSALTGHVSKKNPLPQKTQDNMNGIRLSNLYKDNSIQATTIKKIDFSQMSIQDLDNFIADLSTKNPIQGKTYFSILPNNQLDAILNKLKTNEKFFTMALLASFLTTDQINAFNRLYPQLKKNVSS